MNEFLSQELKELSEKLGTLTKRFEGKTILVTGAAGFVGSWLVGLLQWLNKNQFTHPATIIAVDNYITGMQQNPFIDMNDEHLLFEKVDITKPFTPKKRPDLIIHGAGIASPVFYAKYPLETMTSTIDGLRNILELAREAKPEAVLYFSSSEIYGDPDPKFIPTPETYNGNVSPTGLRACYDEAKRFGETLSTVYHRLYDIPVVLVRPFNVYGPGMKIDDQRVLPNFLNAALNGKTLEIYNRGDQTRTFCYATDAVNGFLRVLLSGKPGEAYNIGMDKEEISMADLAKRVETAVGKKLDIQIKDYPEGYPVGDPNRRCPALEKARTNLDYEPTTFLDEGLIRMLKWYQLLRG